LPGRSRCIVVHPATPPHLLPVTEICPALSTDQAVTHACFAFMERCREVPVLIRFEQSNFVLNRLQAALMVEMLRCLNSGIISAGDVDLNAAEGIRDYLTRYGFIFDAMAKQNGHDGTVKANKYRRFSAWNPAERGDNL
jgi:L-gulonate 3-dehydrogenase